jgi:protein-tyrosine phosphatase
MFFVNSDNDIDAVLYEKMYTFSNFSNWIVPGKVMLGRNPYVEPAHCHSKLELDLPIVDLGIPSSQNLSSLLVQLTDLLTRKEKLNIHCW